MLSSNQTLSPYTRRSLPYSRLAYLFIVLVLLLFLLLLFPLPLPLPSPALSLEYPRCAAASKALDYLPLISARVAHLLPRLPRLPRPKDQPLPSPSCRFFPALPFILLPTSYHLRRAPPAYFLRFFVLFSSAAAILINALTLPLHNCACPLPDSGGSNNTISRVYRELLIGTMSPCSASPRSIRLDLTAIERQLTNQHSRSYCVYVLPLSRPARQLHYTLFSEFFLLIFLRLNRIFSFFVILALSPIVPRYLISNIFFISRLSFPNVSPRSLLFYELYVAESTYIYLKRSTASYLFFNRE